MNWHELLAVLVFAAAAAGLGWRSYRALRADGASGCGSACHGCAHTTPAKSGKLLTIEPAPHSHASHR